MHRKLPGLACVLLLCACERDHLAGTAGTTDVSMRGARGVVDTLRISGPTVLAFFAITQAEVDEATSGASEALADFQYYLPPVRDSLRTRGVALRESYADTVLILRETGAERFAPREHEAPVGYVLFAPDHAPRIEYGVMTDLDLLTVADEYFAW